MAVALHLHGLYRRPASRLRPSGWWRPAVIARCLPTAALLALAVDACSPRRADDAHGRGGDDAARRSLGSVRTSTDCPDVRPDRDPDPGSRNGSDLGPTDVEAADGAPTPWWSVMSTTTPAPGTRRSAASTICRTCAPAHEIDRVIVAFPNTSDAIVLEALRRLEGQVPVSEIPRYFELHNWRSEPEELHGLTLMHMPTAVAGSKRADHEAAHGRNARHMRAGVRRSGVAGHRARDQAGQPRTSLLPPGADRPGR